MENLSEFLSFSLGGYSVSRILSALLTFFVCLIAVRLAMKLLSRLLGRSQHLSERLCKLILNAFKALLYLLTILVTAEALGVNTASLTAIMSVLTLGVTLAAEDILGNVAGGLVILFSHPFSPGDEIEVSGTAGVVREIALTHTKIETFDGQLVLQPNREMSSSKIVNFSALGRRRIVYKVTASYDAPSDAVKAACMDAVSAFPAVLKTPAPSVYLSSYGASAIEYTLRCWTATADYWPTYFKLYETLRETFSAHGVEMTYDHLNVHLVPEERHEDQSC